jgi:hypothetical protein
VLLGAELWLAQQGGAWLSLAPLFVAIGFQISGYHHAANYATIATLVWWLIFPWPFLIVVYFWH